MMFNYLKVRPQGFVVSNKDKYFGFNEAAIKNELNRVSFDWKENTLISLSYFNFISLILYILFMAVNSSGDLSFLPTTILLGNQFFLYIELNRLNLNANSLATFLPRREYAESLLPATPELMDKYREQRVLNTSINDDLNVQEWDRYIDERLSKNASITAFEVMSAIRDLKGKVNTHKVRQESRNV